MKNIFSLNRQEARVKIFQFQNLAILVFSSLRSTSTLAGQQG